MAARVYWITEQNKQLIVLEFSGEWTSKEYASAIDSSVKMLDEVEHPVAIIMDFLSNKKQAFAREVIDECLSGIKRWRTTKSYADIWVSTSSGYWERLLIWMLSRVYNPVGYEVGANLEEACQIAREKLAEKASR